MLGIRIIGDEVLRKVAEDVTTFDEDLENLAQEMIETMHESDGIGLAAPQVGISRQLLVTDISSIDAKMGPLVFVNPEHPPPFTPRRNALDDRFSLSKISFTFNAAFSVSVIILFNSLD